MKRKRKKTESGERKDRGEKSDEKYQVSKIREKGRKKRRGDEVMRKWNKI